MSDYGEIEKREDAQDEPKSAKFWHMELAAAHQREDKWRERAKKVIDRFKDERDGSKSSSEKKFNILWSNTEVLRSALTIAPSSPDVRRRYGTNDKKGRFAALTLERAVDYSADETGMFTQVDLCVEDAILPGRAVAWVVYDADIDGEGEEERIAGQTCWVEWVHWADYREGNARCWKKVPWVARAHYMTREELKELSEQHGAKVPLNATVKGAKEDGESETMRRACVWEVWDKENKQRVYVSEEYPLVLRVDDDPYSLQRFFPCPEPWYAVKCNDSRSPIPLYTLYQDQASELDRITSRIYALTEHLKWRGVYDASQDDNAQLQDLARAKDGEFLPVKSWSSFAEKGGLKGAVQEMDIATIANVVVSLQQERQLLVQQIYEITGISDIIRGSTDPRETKGAQQLKAQFGSMRMQSLTRDKERFVKELYEIKAELIAEHYQPEILSEITQVELPSREQIEMEMARLQAAVQQSQMLGHPVDPNLQGQMAKMQEAVTWDDVMEILRSDARRGYAVNVETDASVLADAEAEKQARAEVVQTVVELLGNTMQAAQINPGIVPLAKELTMFMLGAHKVGRSIEEAVEDAFESMQQAQAQPQPDPEAEKAKIEAQQAEQEMAMEREKHALDMEKGRLDFAKSALQAGIVDPAAISQIIGSGEQQSGGMSALAQQIASLSDVIQRQAATASAPKEVIYGPDGRIVGVKPVAAPDNRVIN